MGIVSNHMPFPWLTVFFLLFLFATPLDTRIPDDDENRNIGDMANSTKSAAPPPSEPVAESRTTSSVTPGIAVIMGVITTIFSITFLILLYVKHCKRGSYINSSGSTPQPRRPSGIDRRIIESLPLFRFSSLRGQKDGLECAICLNRFESDEVLRLLPKCKHAFHVDCVDTWLEGHSTCPLCRYRVDAEDVLLVDGRALYNYSGQITPRSSDQGKRKKSPKPRSSGRHSSAGERGTALEIIVENPGEDLRGRISLDSWYSRQKIGHSEKLRRIFSSKSLDSWRKAHETNEPGKDWPLPGRRSSEKWKSSWRQRTTGTGKDGSLPVTPEASRKDGQLLVLGDKHRLEHRIIISGAAESEEEVGQRRWSDVHAADLLYLRSEMIFGGGGAKEEEQSGRWAINERSASEMRGVSRYRSYNGGERQRQGAVERWMAWISQPKTTAVAESVAAVASPSYPTGI